MDEAWRTPVLTIESFVGHRVWRLVPFGGEPILASATSGDPWLGAEVAAECFAGSLLEPRERRVVDEHHLGESSPALDCTCGVYASKVPMAPPHRRVWASGPVRMWGRVIEGTKGYRAARARIEDDFVIFLGMGPGIAHCTALGCRQPATGVWTGATAFLARCDLHGQTIEFDRFEDWVASAARRRYGVGATLAGR
jgi:hypothetical protein